MIITNINIAANCCSYTLLRMWTSILYSSGKMTRETSSENMKANLPLQHLVLC